MAYFVNDYKDFSMVVWPTYQEEYEKEPYCTFRVYNHVEPALGDVIEMQSFNFTRPSAKYVIDEIIEVKPSIAWENMKTVKVKFSKFKTN